MQATANSAGTGPGAYLFVCYAHDQRDLVVSEIEWLREQGFEVWFDEAIEAGQRWSEDLALAIEGCGAMLFFMSPRSVSSRYCLDEIHFALECGRPIVPVEVEPSELTPGLRLSLGGTHRIFMHRMSAGDFRAKLASGLHRALGGLPPPARGASPTAGHHAPPPGPLFSAHWRPAAFGVFAALVAFIAMMAIGP
ncbi:toll/interleukin-1 receptor domain-containing protein [Thioalkalivibrio sp. XN279]|uniref:toll/interleukin-1 receptor domain-containing protein n=1 Tax=Thioalkalivibrio sp. XN279 TaxID=2714953 RepID=UPI00140D3435|nr:toll/interleukin-1 receptor domain-containing protein [Thioalkalivibrio sp. XN279]NHA14416.1 toll/interleukin-1 receptor domain-containing protein [Thioalkalivibrio sp. XN279]